MRHSHFGAADDALECGRSVTKRRLPWFCLPCRRNVSDIPALFRAKRTMKGEPMPDIKTAILYRMVLPDHTCPFGVRAKELLEAAGYEIDDRLLRSRQEVDAFKAEHSVETTPQTFIDGERIGGSDELEYFLSR